MNSAATSRPREGVALPSSESDARNERLPRMESAEIRSMAACSGAVSKAKACNAAMAVTAVAFRAARAGKRFPMQKLPLLSFPMLKQGTGRFLRLLKQEPDLAATSQKAHPPILPELRLRDRARLGAGRNPATLTSLANR